METTFSVADSLLNTPCKVIALPWCLGYSYSCNTQLGEPMAESLQHTEEPKQALSYLYSQTTRVHRGSGGAHVLCLSSKQKVRRRQMSARQRRPMRGTEYLLSSWLLRAGGRLRCALVCRFGGTCTTPSLCLALAPICVPYRTLPGRQTAKPIDIGKLIISEKC